MILTVTLNTSVDKLYMLDQLAPYTVMRVKQVQNTAGGKGLNVSRVAAQLGQPVTAMGFVGGHNGRYFESLITEPAIQKAFTQIAAETRCCINGWDMEKGLSTEYLEPGAAVTPEEAARFLADFEHALPKASVVTLSGSLPGGLPADFYAALIRRCHEAGKPVLLDTSGEALRQAVAACPSLIKPNTDELYQLTQKPCDTREAVVAAAVALHEGGVPTVVVSLGAQGALVACDAGVFAGTPPRITPRNTVGCGDSMVAGFAAGIAQGLSVPEQLRLAVAVSAANALCMRTGGFDPHDLETLTPLVEVNRIL